MNARSVFGFRIVVLAFAFAAAGVALAASAPRPSNKWRIECSSHAETTGIIQFRVTPLQGTPIDVTATIAAHTGENAVARAIRDAFIAQLPTDRFSSETDDGEDVLVKKRHGQPDFLLELVQSTVTGPRFHLQRE